MPQANRIGAVPPADTRLASTDTERMTDPLRIDAATMQALVDRAELLHIAAFPPADCGRVDVPRELDALRQRLKVQHEEHLQPWFVLLDECVQFFIQFERYLYEVPLSSNLTAYAVTISKLKRDLVAIRELLAFGQDMAANVLARTFIENIEIAMALALDAATCEAFAHTTDTNSFWNKHIGYGRVYEQMLRYAAHMSKHSNTLVIADCCLGIVSGASEAMAVGPNSSSPTGLITQQSWASSANLRTVRAESRVFVSCHPLV